MNKINKLQNETKEMIDKKDNSITLEDVLNFIENNTDSLSLQKIQSSLSKQYNPIDKNLITKIKELRSKGLSLNKIAKEVNKNISTVRRYLEK